MAAEQKPSLTLKRRLAAPVEKVFRAWTEGQALSRWFSPANDAHVIADLDARVGGRYRIVVREAGGAEHRVGGVYRIVEPNSKLVFTWAWESTPERESLVTVALAPAGDNATDLTLTHEQFFDEPARERHNAGWLACFERLEKFVSQD